jgi:hypothetical protein
MLVSMNPEKRVEIIGFLACYGHFLRHLGHFPRFKTQSSHGGAHNFGLETGLPCRPAW